MRPPSAFVSPPRSTQRILKLAGHMARKNGYEGFTPTIHPEDTETLGVQMEADRWGVSPPRSTQRILKQSNTSILNGGANVSPPRSTQRILKPNDARDDKHEDASFTPTIHPEDTETHPRR